MVRPATQFPAGGSVQSTRGGAAGGAASTRIVVAFIGARVVVAGQQGCILAAGMRMRQTRGIGVTGKTASTATSNRETTRLTTGSG